MAGVEELGLEKMVLVKQDIWARPFQQRVAAQAAANSHNPWNESAKCVTNPEPGYSSRSLQRIWDVIYSRYTIYHRCKCLIVNPVHSRLHLNLWWTSSWCFIIDSYEVKRWILYANYRDPFSSVIYWRSGKFFEFSYFSTFTLHEWKLSNANLVRQWKLLLMKKAFSHVKCFLFISIFLVGKMFHKFPTELEKQLSGIYVKRVFSFLFFELF